MIHINVKKLDIRVTFRVTFSYASNNFEEKKGLWNKISTLSSRNNLPWVVRGDLNNILHSFKRVEGDMV